MEARLDVNNGIDAAEFAEFVAVAAEFARAVPGAAALDLDVKTPDTLERCWHELCAIGLDRCLLGEDEGGIGMPDTALAPLVEAIAAGDGGLALLMLQSNIALSSLASERAAAIAETARWAFVPGAGGAAPCAELPEFHHGRVSGSVRFALGAENADGMVLVCRYGDAKVLVAVERDAEAKVERSLDDHLGLRSAPTAALTMSDTPAVLIDGPDAAERAEALLNAGVAAIARGVAARAGELALEYAENRYQGGGPIIIHGAVRDMLARISERRLAITPQPDLTGRIDLATALAQKIVSTDAAVESTIDAVQVFGGMGYMHETGAEKLMRDAKYCQLYPTPNWLARDELLELQRSPGR